MGPPPCRIEYLHPHCPPNPWMDLPCGSEVELLHRTHTPAADMRRRASPRPWKRKNMASGKAWMRMGMRIAMIRATSASPRPVQHAPKLVFFFVLFYFILIFLYLYSVHYNYNVHIFFLFFCSFSLNFFPCSNGIYWTVKCSPPVRLFYR